MRIVRELRWPRELQLVLMLMIWVALVWTYLYSATPAQAQSENPIVTENQQLGSDQWQLGKTGYYISSDATSQIKGYASKTSVNKGEPITFYVTVNQAQTYTMDIYRMGWYQGKGGRLMQSIGPLDGIKQTGCPTDASTGLIECNWSPSHTLTVPTTWTSGVYIALLTNASKYQSHIVFVVRDDARKAELLYQQSVTTYQAYNNYPNYKNAGLGKSLYESNSYGENTLAGTTRAVKVSFDRPYANIWANGIRNSGAGQFFSWEYYFVRWLERSGYDVAYSTNIDTHASGARLLNYKGFLSVGHDEYWSKEMYDAAEAARDSGINLGFFGANDVYWQIRMEPSSTGAANRVVVRYKEAALDPVQGATTTVKWRDPLVNRPEQTLIGIQTTAELYPNADYVVKNSSNWVYEGAGLSEGSAVTGIVGYETNRYMPEYPLPVHTNWTVLSESHFTDKDGRADYANSSIYQAPSGAWVFAAGTISWSWGLDRDTYAHPAIQQATANILDRYVDTVPPSGTVAINGGATYANSAIVGIDVPASDAHTTVTHVRVSNSPDTSGGQLSLGITYPYATSLSWDLADAATGGSGTNGTRAVYVQWRDKVGNWSTVASDTIVLDTGLPVVAAPREALVLGSALGTGTVPVRVAWSGSDATSGIAQYQLQESVNGGTFADVSLTSATATTVTRSLTPGYKYQYRLRARDGASNWSGWSTGTAFTVGAHQESSASITYTTGWKATKLSGAYGGYVKYATAGGNKASFSFTGRNVAWVAPKSSARGLAEVWVDGAKVATVDLYSSSTLARRVVFTRAWDSVGTHTLEVRVLGTKNSLSSRTRVDVDAFVLLR